MPEIEAPITTALFSLLSQLVALDRVAATRLVEFRIPCNAAVEKAIDPAIAVRTVDERSGSYEFGVIGLLQSLCAKEGKKLQKVYDSNGQLGGFRVTSNGVGGPFNFGTDI